MRVTFTVLIHTIGLVATALGAHAGAAQETRKLNFQSAYDRFDLVLSGDRGTVDGKPADLTGLKELLPSLLGEVTNACPDTKGRPDVTVREGANEKTIFLKAGVLRQGKNCLSVGGEGLFFIPLHRDYLIGPREDEVTLGPDLSVARDGAVVMTLKRVGKEWIGADATKLPNEDFFRRFTETIAKFSVRQRASLSLAEGKKRVTVKTGGKTYEFFKVSEVAWALKKPAAKWLETSDDWSFWYDLDDHTIEDRYAEQIRTAGDASREVEERLGVMRRFESTWSNNLSNLYRRIALEPNADPRLTAVAMRRLKRKPSRDTAAIMVEILESTQPDELKVEAAGNLRLQNPKGPKFTRGNPTEQARVVRYWREWLNKVAP